MFYKLGFCKLQKARYVNEVNFVLSIDVTIDDEKYDSSVDSDQNSL